MDQTTYSSYSDEDGENKEGDGDNADGNADDDIEQRE